MANEQLPRAGGSYVLGLELSRSRKLKVGRLGEVTLPAGVYAYAGSAFGSGGLQARLGRHLRGDGAKHWHIDYVRAVAKVRFCFYTVTDTSLECAWSQALAAMPGATLPVPGLGASDCRSGCGAHLIALPLAVDLGLVQQTLVQLSGQCLRYDLG